MDRFGAGWDCNTCGSHVPSGITSCPTCVNIAHTKRMADAAEAQAQNASPHHQTVTVLHLSPEESARSARFGDNGMAWAIILLGVMLMFSGQLFLIPFGIILVAYMLRLISLK